MKYVFGPVPSRRLGNSLGVDLLTLKACTFDCVYCQLGRTTEQTTERRSFVPAEEVVAEVREVLASGAAIDHITLSGSGEPTLSLDLGRVIHAIKAMTGEGDEGPMGRFSIADCRLPIANPKSEIGNRKSKIPSVPVAVITNGSLLWREDVRADLAEADLVIPSLDAARAETFERINRPHGLDVATIARGIRDFTLGFGGRVWLEVLVVAGINDSVEEAEAIVGALEGARFDRVQLNTVVRAPAEAWAEPASEGRLAEMAKVLEALAPVDIIGRYAISDSGLRIADSQSKLRDPKSEILATLARRPCGAGELAASLGLDRSRVVEQMQALERAGTIERVLVAGQAQYRLKGNT